MADYFRITWRSVRRIIRLVVAQKWNEWDWNVRFIAASKSWKQTGSRRTSSRTVPTFVRLFCPFATPSPWPQIDLDATAQGVDPVGRNS